MNPHFDGCLGATEQRRDLPVAKVLIDSQRQRFALRLGQFLKGPQYVGEGLTTRRQPVGARPPIGANPHFHHWDKASLASRPVTM